MAFLIYHGPVPTTAPVTAAPFSRDRRDTAPAAPRSPGDVVYDFGVASYCGTLTQESEAGFRQELAKMTARFHRDAAEARNSRLTGWLKPDLEWANRGLGGFRRWCETEGMTAAQRFAEIARGERDP